MGCTTSVQPQFTIPPTLFMRTIPTIPRSIRLLIEKLPLYIILSCSIIHSLALPEHPVISRDIATYSSSAEMKGWSLPHIPAHRTTNDGRITLSVESSNASAENIVFFLNRPENLDTHFDETSGIIAAGSGIIGPVYKFKRSYLFGSTDYTPIHRTLWDPTVNESADGQSTNPYTLGDGYDYYDLEFICLRRHEATRKHTWWKRPIRIKVANPKTPNAHIASIIHTGDPVISDELEASHSVWEPMITNDGHLVVGRIGRQGHSFVNPITGEEEIISGVDTVYAYSETPGDITAWTNLIPLSFAPHDPRVNQRYGFAMHPFRDMEGQSIRPGQDWIGTYPWIDREGNNVFFYTTSAQLDELGVSRYPNTDTAGNPVVPGNPWRKWFPNNGLAVAGLWTKGKIIMVDNLLNNTDYDDTGIAGAVNERLISLYAPNSGVNGDETGIIHVSAGRAKGGVGGGTKNTQIFGSLENIFHYHQNLAMTRPNDVVWRVSNGKCTDEFAFDDYLYHDSFIVSHMTASVTSLDGWRGNKYHDGWNYDDKAFTNPIRIANAGTALPERWNVPTHGDAFSDWSTIRVEPVALGGIEGKGLWVDWGSGIKYEIPAQPQDVASSDWYFGLFIDPRFTNNSVMHKMLHFPDDSRLKLQGRRAIAYYKGEELLRTIPLPFTLPEKGWSHIGVQLSPGAAEIELYLNGMLIDRWENTTGNSLFQLTEGDLYVGAKQGLGADTGIRAWIDDFKVFGQRFNPEELANHARATLVGLSGAYTGDLEAIAAHYPAIAHTELTTLLASNNKPTFTRYAPYYDYTRDKGAHLGNIPQGAAGLREYILMPEGPLGHDQPRPDSATNQFCLQCHSETSFRGLGMDALSLDGSLAAATDPRRQPSQALPTLRGVIPENWLIEQLEVSARRGTFNNSLGDALVNEAMEINGSALQIDEWLLAFANADSSDLDSDHMDDQWELEQFGDTTSQDDSTDKDQDNTPDWQEYRLKMNPLDPKERFKLGIKSSKQDGVSLRWPSQPGLTFRVHYSHDLSLPRDEWESIDTSTTSEEAILSLLEPSDDGTRAFYTVELLAD